MDAPGGEPAHHSSRPFGENCPFTPLHGSVVVRTGAVLRSRTSFAAGEPKFVPTSTARPPGAMIDSAPGPRPRPTTVRRVPLVLATATEPPGRATEITAAAGCASSASAPAAAASVVTAAAARRRRIRFVMLALLERRPWLRLVHDRPRGNGPTTSGSDASDGSGGKPLAYLGRSSRRPSCQSQNRARPGGLVQQNERRRPAAVARGPMISSATARPVPLTV